jgi:hypothetical protein
MRRLEPAALLGLGRIAVFGLWGINVAVAPVARYSELPPELFEAPGLLRMVPDAAWMALIGSPSLLWTLHLSLLAGLLLLVLGIRPFRAIAVPVFLLLLVFDGLDKGFNDFVHHAQIGILFAALLLCFFPAADALSILGRPRALAPPRVYGGGVLAIAAFLCAAYAFIGTNRVVAGGFAIFTGDAIVTYMVTQSINYSAYGFDYGLLALRHAWVATLFKAGYAVTTLLEILSPFCLISTWFRRLWLVVIVPFHVSTLFTMNIFFWENIVLIAVFVAPAGLLIASLEEGVGARAGGARLVADGVAGSVVQPARGRA